MAIWYVDRKVQKKQYFIRRPRDFLGALMQEWKEGYNVKISVCLSMRAHSYCVATGSLPRIRENVWRFCSLRLFYTGSTMLIFIQLEEPEQQFKFYVFIPAPSKLGGVLGTVILLQKHVGKINIAMLTVTAIQEHI